MMLNIVMPIYDLIEYSDNYSKKSEISFEFWREVPTVDNSGAVTDFTESNATSDSVNRKVKWTGQTGDNGTKYVEIMVPLKHLSNF